MHAAFFNTTMSYKDYRLYRTIQSPDFDSVNVLAFSKDCKLFAAGLENGAVITFHTDGGRKVAQYQKDAAAIDAILWSVGSDKDKDKDKHVLFVGTRTGKLFRYSRPDKKVSTLARSLAPVHEFILDRPRLTRILTGWQA